MRIVIVKPKAEPVIGEMHNFWQMSDILNGCPIMSEIKLRDEIRIFISEEADYREKDFNRAIYEKRENKVLPKYRGTLYGTVIIANSSIDLFPMGLSEEDAEEMITLFKGEEVIIDFQKK